MNLLLLVIAAATFAYARHQRDIIETKTAVLFKRNANSPAELNRIRDELSQMDLTQAQLNRELDGRIQYLKTLQSEEFYISIDTQRKKMQFRLGRSVVRECDVRIGEAKTITSPAGKTWTFLPLKGGFSVTGKEDGYDWSVPEWVYAMHGQTAPAARAVVPNGLGRYVIFLPNSYVIHSPPPPQSPLQGPKPGSFMVPEADLAAIWPRITTQTRVYIF
ncbi:MAG TPA: L,D-transpeptidase [Thermoanaerobaculia bacterium]